MEEEKFGVPESIFESSPFPGARRTAITSWVGQSAVTTLRDWRHRDEDLPRLRVGECVFVDRGWGEVVVPFDDDGFGGFGEGCIS